MKRPAMLPEEVRINGMRLILACCEMLYADYTPKIGGVKSHVKLAIKRGIVRYQEYLLENE